MSHMVENRRVGRAAALVLLAVAIAYGIGGATIEYAFSSDPLGPRAFPVMLAVVLGGLSLLYLVWPGRVEAIPTGRALLRVLAIPAILVVSIALFEPLGFAGATFLLTFGAALVFGAPVKHALIGAVLQTALWWTVFAYLLQVYLPAGALFG
ncbi:tripartite tricarboxylate transporter TctB (plasmid) [Aminobacter sp. Y103A]|uniref:tripartite tricarboxylate transporter TctB family protein n=1 Tax=Aminobacter sp. Y103A TaxID=1870862 RepID=UPI0025724A79|nr:tripartite tricarboxylate transporter TctB family protein [Aminobacter sp. SS-2016]BBD41506.1 tripartite tricarboxylate transporter TctB [Aminobacter sp. SS-2016]